MAGIAIDFDSDPEEIKAFNDNAEATRRDATPERCLECPTLRVQFDRIRGILAEVALKTGKLIALEPYAEYVEAPNGGIINVGEMREILHIQIEQLEQIKDAFLKQYENTSSQCSGPVSSSFSVQTPSGLFSLEQQNCASPEYLKYVLESNRKASDSGVPFIQMHITAINTINKTE